jgi:general secretion pathway protein G
VNFVCNKNCDVTVAELKHNAATLRPAASVRKDRMVFAVTDRPNTRNKNRRDAGFTLIELLVVIAILGLLIGFVGPTVIRQFGSAKHKIAEQSIERIVGVLDIYKLDTGNYPTTQDGLNALVSKPTRVSGWNGPYVKDAGALRDPWGRPFDYRSPGQRAGQPFDIISLGADGRSGGDGEDADIVNR